MQKLVSMVWRNLQVVSRNIYQGVSEPSMSHRIELKPIATGQSFEGGISGSPGTEAHGAYAFCALACLCILDRPEEIIPK